MSVISVDTELLQLKSANVKGTVDRISSDVHTMRRGLEELQGTWKGSAANNFQALILEWSLTQSKVEASLASITTALSSAATSYSEVEHGNTQRFTY
ncbi:WXG100 family type VII secretion target [Paenarthrobacter ilicis]|uniref:ESAT-6-like protein n=1 Tax=Paenarthrobacter ilicis TaxID=43665 RepID=A0ABX0TFF3_9MICC|nr:WXG100 family type VII secretion target [Paenarthrobacter ilicis]MBM7792297.1 WXG100 family type VII secretion target [Paenarthrobacter ilicis]NIJ00641.1 WXG100 family type VII secretion target [Paenarthrobacter ilicis]